MPSDRLVQVSPPMTQSIRLRWRPELRFYEQRTAILRELEDLGVLSAFRFSEGSVDARLPDWRWLSVTESGLTLNILTESGDEEASWGLVETVISKIAPLRYSQVRVSYQHVVELPLSMEQAIARSYEGLFRPLDTPEVAVTDWAVLADLRISGVQPAKGKVEFGIVSQKEVSLRLKKLGGRDPGMEHLGSRDWEASEFKEVSLFADSDLQCIAPDEGEQLSLEDARAFWGASREQMGRLADEWHGKLTGNEGD
jgi:hypothetical protein